MILELTGLCSLDRPVTRVMNARGHFVRKQCPVDGKELQREHSHVVEAVHYPPTVLDCKGRDLGCDTRCGRNRLSQNSLAVEVLDRRIKNLAAARVPDSDHGKLMLEINVLLDQQR